MKERGKFKLFVGYGTFEFYYPYFYFNHRNWGFSAHTQLNVFTYDEQWEWMLVWSAAWKVLGFGMGFAWKHTDNPKVKESYRESDGN